MVGTAEFFKDKVVLITGASSGIGEELARQLAQARAKVALAARRKDVLESLAQKIAAGGQHAALAFECDVTRDGDVERAVAETVRQWGKLDVVIANAGFGIVGPLRQLTLEDYRRQFETNVFGLLRTVLAALPEIEKSKGNVVLIGSVSGWAASPGASPYAMSKFAVRALANSITPELQLAGVKVTLISPGFVASDIRRVDNRGQLHAGAKDPVPAWLIMSTEKAARQILQAVARGKREAIITGHGKLLVALERFFPWVTRAVGKKLAAGKGGYRTEPKTE
ncbi:MAG TPA: SDR family oxidoreductase [Verrucomicrobiae bacterium]|jgi:short-subunit dehydrogenase|nr:SDR family oxidoreductase [Verrucomicrobiae bacterium]